MARHTLSVTPVISPPHIFERPTCGMFSSQVRLPRVWHSCSCGWQCPVAVLFPGRKGCTAVVYCERLTCCLTPKPVVGLMRTQVSKVSDLAVCDLHEAPVPFALQQRCCAVANSASATITVSIVLAIACVAQQVERLLADLEAELARRYPQAAN